MLLQRENGETTTLPPTPEFRLQMPTMGGTSSLPFSEIHLEVPPLMLDLIEQRLDSEVIRQGLSQIEPGAPTVPSLPGAAAAGVPAPEPTPLVPASPGPETPREGSAGDLFRAIAAVPAIESTLQGLQTAALDQVRHDWDRLSAGERAAAITAAVLVGGGALAGVLSHPDTRQMAIRMFDGQTFPVPGVRGLSAELNLSGEDWMVGFHLDVGALLPESWGFGPGSPTAIGGPPTPPERQTESEEEPVQPKRESNQVVQVTADIEERINALRGGGHPLSEAERAYFEPRFGYDFSQVRVHTGAQATESAQVVNAWAYTVGSDVVFGAGQFTPETVQGKKLLAHELTHVVQQNGAKQDPEKNLYSLHTHQGSSPSVEPPIIHSVSEAVQGCWIVSPQGERLYDPEHPLARLFFDQYPTYAPGDVPEPVNVEIRAVLSEGEVRYVAYGLNPPGVEIGEVTGYQTPEQRGAQSRNPPEESIAVRVREMTEGIVDLSSASIQLTIPANTVLSDTFARDLVAVRECQVEIVVDRNWLSIGFNPALSINILYPMEDLLLHRLSWWFDRATPEVILRTDPSSQGWFSSIDSARSELMALLRNLLDATVFSQPGYNPMADDQLMTHLRQVGENFQSQMSPGEVEDDSTEELGGVEGVRVVGVGATFIMRSGFQREIVGTSVLNVPEGANFDVSIQTAGDLTQIIERGQARDVEGAIRVARIQNLDLRSDRVNVIRNGEPVLNLSHLRWQDGRVQIMEQTQTVSEDAETVGDALVDLIGASPAMLGLLLSALVDILITENRHAISGIDLVELLGIHPTD